jgi:AMMECR1 domain-containing protein
LVLGVDGAHLTSGLRRGLLLPQVADGPGWTRDRFFEALARKCGVDGRVFSQSSTRLHVFRAQVFGRRCGNPLQ